MKKYISILLAGVLVLALAACSSAGTTAPAGTAAPGALAGPGENASDAGTTNTAAPAANPGESSGSAAQGTASGKKYSVGICQLMQHDALDAATLGFRDAITEALGAENVTFDEQNAQGDSSTCSTIVTGFAANGYDLILANATPALQAAVAATTTIPILGTSITDYAAALAMDFDPDEGTGINVSGSSDGVPGQMYVDLVFELVPDAKNISVVYCSAEANSVVQADAFIEALPGGVNCTRYTFADSNDMQSVVIAAAESCDAMYIPTDNIAASNMTIVRNVCEPAKIPLICGEENMCALGGLATVSINYYNIGYVCGEQAVQILRDGADVSTMPIAYASDLVKEYNADYAAAIGFEIPDGFTPIG